MKVIHKIGAKVTPLAVHEFGMGEGTAALSLACWLVRRSEQMPLLNAQLRLAIYPVRCVSCASIHISELINQMCYLMVSCYQVMYCAPVRNDQVTSNRGNITPLQPAIHRGQWYSEG